MENIVQRKNKDNQTYIDCVMGLLRYFELGEFHIRELKNYGYQVYIEKKDENADFCNGSLIDITELGISIKRYTGLDNNNCHTFTGWKYFARYSFTPEMKDYDLEQMKYHIHCFENNWPEIANKKMVVSDNKLVIEEDFK